MATILFFIVMSIVLVLVLKLGGFSKSIADNGRDRASQKFLRAMARTVLD